MCTIFRSARRLWLVLLVTLAVVHVSLLAADPNARGAPSGLTRVARDLVRVQLNNQLRSDSDGY